MRRSCVARGVPPRSRSGPERAHLPGPPGRVVGASGVVLPPACLRGPAPVHAPSGADEETTSIEEQRRINAEIKVPRVRLVDADGSQVGIVPLAQALRRAREQDLDLVEVANQADPPVCRIMDWGKHRYEQEQKDKDARRRQSQIVIKEIKMRPKISSNDYGTKSGHVRRFLLEGAKVRASIMFRGREMAHTELGLRLLQRLAEDMSELATIEAEPKVDGRNMVMVLAPVKSRLRAAPTPTADGDGPADGDGAADQGLVAATTGEVETDPDAA